MSGQGRLWGLRLTGLVLLIATGYIVYYTVSAGRPRSFWQDKFPNRVNLFSLAGSWTDERGRTVSLQDFAGAASIVSFVYLDCAVTCPRIIQDLKTLDQKLPRKTRFVLFLFDDRKRSEREVSEFRRRHGIEAENWRVLWAPPPVLRRLADVFELGYEKGKGGRFDYAHTNFYAVVGPDGKVRREIRGLPTSTEEFVSDVRGVLD